MVPPGCDGLDSGSQPSDVDRNGAHDAIVVPKFSIDPRTPTLGASQVGDRTGVTNGSGDIGEPCRRGNQIHGRGAAALFAVSQLPQVPASPTFDGSEARDRAAVTPAD